MLLTTTTATTVVTPISSLLATLLASSATPLATPSAIQLGSPLANINFPDPAIIWAEGKWWSFATATRGNALHQHFQVASSVDYLHWTIETYPDGKPYDPLEVLPSWVDSTALPETWAPDVVKLDDGSFVMYWSAKKADTPSTHCVSAATSKNVRGPYIPLDQILVCPNNSLGAFDVAGFKGTLEKQCCFPCSSLSQSIDWAIKGDWSLPVGNYKASPRRRKCRRKPNDGCGNSYIDNAWSEGGFGGQRFIVYKWQNFNNTALTPITLQAVASDGITLLGQPIMILNNTSEDFGSVEAPSIYKTPNHKYVLTYSKGNTVTSMYTVSYAVASSLIGPYNRMGDLLKTGDYNLNGPGGADLNFNGERMLFHEMAQGPGWAYNGTRVMSTLR